MPSKEELRAIRAGVLEASGLAPLKRRLQWVEDGNPYRAENRMLNRLADFVASTKQGSPNMIDAVGALSQALADRDARIGELEKTQEPVHYVSYASQPYVRITCTGVEEYVYAGKGQDGLPAGVHKSDGGLYSFEREPVTCLKCLLAEGVSYDECMNEHSRTKAQLARVVGALREIQALAADRGYGHTDEVNLMKIDAACELTLKELDHA